MCIDLKKSFKDKMKAVGISEADVIWTVVHVDRKKRGAARLRGGDDEVVEAEDVSKPLTLQERIAIAKAAIISVAAKYARPAVAGALLISTHKAFIEHLCNPAVANIAKSTSFLPIVGQYSEQCDTAQSTYTKAMRIAVGIATTILLPQIREGLTRLKVPDEMVKVIADTIGNKSEADDTDGGYRRGAKKTRRTGRKSRKTKSRRH